VVNLKGLLWSHLKSYIEERAHRRAKGGRCTQLSLREEDFTRNRRASVPNVILEQ
jgi:hypothetical protein